MAFLPWLRGKVSQILGIVILVVLGIWLIVNFVQTPAAFTSVLLSGLTNGAVYALVALGYTLVYGIIELINFAHGDVFMWGTMISVLLGVKLFGLDGSQSGLVRPARCWSCCSARRRSAARSTSRSNGSPTAGCATRRGSRR